MHVPAYLQHEIALVNPLYFFVWNPNRGRWQLRKWFSSWARDDSRRSWELNSDKIYTFCIIGEDQEDVGYEPINMESVHTAKEGFYWGRHTTDLLAHIDKENSRLIEQDDAEQTYIHRYAAKVMWHHFRENQLDMGAN
jgi:hypothetical protein